MHVRLQWQTASGADMRETVALSLLALGMLSLIGHAQPVPSDEDLVGANEITTAYELMGRAKVGLAQAKLQSFSSVLENDDLQQVCIRDCQSIFVQRMDACSKTTSDTEDQYTNHTFLDVCFNVALTRLNACLEPTGRIACISD